MSCCLTFLFMILSVAGALVAGLMLALLRRVPREGDRIVWSGWRFEIVDMDGRRVDKVLVSREEANGVG